MTEVLKRSRHFTSREEKPQAGNFLEPKAHSLIFFLGCSRATDSCGVFALRGAELNKVGSINCTRLHVGK